MQNQAYLSLLYIRHEIEEEEEEEDKKNTKRSTIRCNFSLTMLPIPSGSDKFSSVSGASQCSVSMHFSYFFPFCENSLEATFQPILIDVMHAASDAKCTYAANLNSPTFATCIKR